MMPNYNMVPKALKALRAAPVGNFMAFPAEMVRNSKNILKYAWKDATGATAREMGITDPKAIKELRNIGLKRAAGMTTAVVAGDAAVEQSKNLYDISDGQEDALNKTLPDWEKGRNKIFLSPIKTDPKTGKISVDYVNLGPIDPFSYWKVPVKNVIARIMDNQDYNQEELDILSWDALSQVIEPFVNPSMVAQEALDVYSGKGIDPDASPVEQLAQSVASIAKGAFTPGTVDWFEKRAQYNRTKEKFGTGKTKYGYAIAPGEVDLASFLGVRRQTADLSHGFEWNIKQDLQSINDSKAKFTNAIRDYGGNDAAEVSKLYLESLKNQYKNSKLLKAKLDAYRELGFTPKDMYKALTKSGIASNKKSLFKKIQEVDNDRFVPYRMTKDLMLLAQKETGVPVDYDTLNKIYNYFNGISLEED